MIPWNESRSNIRDQEDEKVLEKEKEGKQCSILLKWVNMYVKTRVSWKTYFVYIRGSQPGGLGFQLLIKATYKKKFNLQKKFK